MKIKLNEMEEIYLPNTKFKTLVIGMLKKLNENFKKQILCIKTEIESIKMNKSEMKNKITGIKNTLERINNRLHKALSFIDSWQNN